MPGRDELDVMIHGVYEAAVGEASWRIVGDRLGQLLGAELVTLWSFRDAEARPLCADQLPAAAEADFHRRYRSLDPWINGAFAALRRPSAERRAFLGTDLIADSALRESEFYRDFARNLGAFHLVGLAMHPDAASGASLAVFRPEAAPGFEETDRKWLDALCPHLARAIFLHQLGIRRTEETVLREAALEALAEAVLVVDTDLRVIVANARAREIAGIGLRRGVGNFLYLTAESRRAIEILAGTVRRVIERGDAGQAVSLRSASGRDDVVADVVPLTQAGASVHRPVTVALIILRKVRTAPSLPSPALLREMFALTAAEAAVAIAVASGHSAPSIAAFRRTTQATVRTQIRSVLEKTGAESLRALAVRLTNLGCSTTSRLN